MDKPQCRGITANGERCKRRGADYCWQHADQRQTTPAPAGRDWMDEWVRQIGLAQSNAITKAMDGLQPKFRFNDQLTELLKRISTAQTRNVVDAMSLYDKVFRDLDFGKLTGPATVSFPRTDMERLLAKVADLYAPPRALPSVADAILQMAKAANAAVADAEAAPDEAAKRQGVETALQRLRDGEMPPVERTDGAAELESHGLEWIQEELDAQSPELDSKMRTEQLIYAIVFVIPLAIAIIDVVTGTPDLKKLYDEATLGRDVLKILWSLMVGDKFQAWRNRPPEDVAESE